MTTVADVFDAIEQNGLPKAIESYFEYRVTGESFPENRRKEKIIAACAIGQAAYNLDVSPRSIWYGLSDALPRKYTNAASFITRLNDFEQDGELTFAEIAERLREEYKDYLDKEISFSESLDDYFGG